MSTTRALALLAAVAGAAAAWAAGKPLTSDTVWDLRTVSDPQITKDGKSVVYVLGWNDRMSDAMHSNLWMVGSDGKDPRPLTTGAFKDSSPRRSPDGARLAYLSNRSGRPQIRVRWMDTGQEAQITDLQDAPSGIEWSPDGKWIAYAARVPAKPSWAVKAPEKPNGAKWADPPIVVTRLRWRADGSGVIQPSFQA